MNEMQIFQNQKFGKLRTLEIEGKLYFVASDIAKALGYTNPSKAISDHCRWVMKRYIPHPQNNSKVLEVNAIPEGDLYRLIANSELPSAQEFELWVFDEVLPSIRKTGHYQQKPMSLPEILELQIQYTKEIEAKVDSVDDDLQNFKQDMPILGIEESRITNAVRRQGVKCLGGKESGAYKDKSLRGKVYADIYGQLKREFGVVTYKAIKRSQCEKAVEIIERYTAPLILADEIRDVNAQMTLCLVV